MAKKGRSALFVRLLKLADLQTHCNSQGTVGDVFDAAFSILKIAGQRDEYIYRAALTQKVLIGRHSLRTASMLNEFRAGDCKADLVIINGTATAYEIKSERDTLLRLSHQVDNYKKVFAAVNVITSEVHLKAVCEMVPNEIGILCLSNKYKISIIREAISQPDRICPLTVFESLRIAESMAILKTLGIEVPELPNTERYKTLREYFSKLKPADVHREMVNVLKQNRSLTSLSKLVDQLPKSLHAAALSTSVRPKDHCHLIRAIKTPLRESLSWS